MNRQEYLGKLREALACLPDGEIDESVAFYAEMIDDRMAASKALVEVSRQWVGRARALFVKRKTEMENDAAGAGAASLAKEAVHEF
ncbi:HAAS signaling domain-containing protein [Adlercreutzia shanghongiae]|uniref:Uncharacterized protein n=1 Tax=Adlercreutzia shanghongiae TaxID=3111773 RepID=A0ABU6IVV8_9ACTN|nr:hypothetical protein [Adlercreutzia sp. R22]MEC4293935.1 hypothetical protein [Adlercreutzia sp. R22]